MTHTFKYEYNDGFGPEYSVRVDTEAVTVDDILEIFKRYLQACGFAFKLDESIIVYDEEEE